MELSTAEVAPSSLPMRGAHESAISRMVSVSSSTVRLKASCDSEALVRALPSRMAEPGVGTIVSAERSVSVACAMSSCGGTRMWIASGSSTSYVYTRGSSSRMVSLEMSSTE